MLPFDMKQIKLKDLDFYFNFVSSLQSGVLCLNVIYVVQT